MKPTPAVLLSQKFLVFLTTLLIFSALLSTAAVARSGGVPFKFYTSQQQQQQQRYQQDNDQKQHPLISEKNQTAQNLIPEYKYFHEAGGTLELTHYDARFFRGTIPYTQHRIVLTHLIRSYLTTFASLNLETWIAHGTLLGWYWNGRIMPWDFDVDAQVTGDTMRVMAEQYDKSVHEYAYVNASTGREQKRVYLLDVNPFAARVGRGKGQNVIDARWIDVETGMFVDITGLVEREPETKPGVVSCKNYHNYRTGELFPLRETEFEGVPAMVPWEYEGILVGEYGQKSLVVTEWEGHRWDPEQNEWVKMEKDEVEKVA